MKPEYVPDRNQKMGIKNTFYESHKPFNHTLTLFKSNSRNPLDQSKNAKKDYPTKSTSDLKQTVNHTAHNLK